MNETNEYKPDDAKENKEVDSQNIERTFLVSKLPENLDDYEHYEIREAVYDMREEGKHDFRVKVPKNVKFDNWHSIDEISFKQDKETCLLSAKVARTADGYAKVMTEELTEEQFNELWDNPQFGRRAIRTRYNIPYKDPHLGDITIQLDIFEAPLNSKGAVTASVDFASEEESKSFTLPDWLGEDLTEEINEDLEKGISIFSGRLIPQRAIHGEALGRLKQTDYYSGTDEEREDIKNKDRGHAIRENEAIDFRARMEAEKSLMKEVSSLNPSEVKRGDVFILEKMGSVDTYKPDILRAFLGNKKEMFGKNKEENEVLFEKISHANSLLELADALPQASGERQILFSKIGDLLLGERKLYNIVAERYKIVVRGIRKERLRNRESEKCLVAEVQKASNEGSVITYQAKIPISDFHLNNLDEEFGSFKADLKDPNYPGWESGRQFDRIGKIYRSSKKTE